MSMIEILPLSLQLLHIPIYYGMYCMIVSPYHRRSILIQIGLLVAMTALLLTGCNTGFSNKNIAGNVLILSRNNNNMSAVRIGSEVVVIDTLYSPALAFKAKKIITAHLCPALNLIYHRLKHTRLD